MAEQLLDRADVRAGLQQVRGERMTQRVDRDRQVDAGGLHRPLQVTLDPLRVEVVPPFHAAAHDEHVTLEVHVLDPQPRGLVQGSPHPYSTRATRAGSPSMRSSTSRVWTTVSTAGTCLRTAGRWICCIQGRSWSSTSR
jgi:hypothetical protein